eukprot:4752_1
MRRNMQLLLKNVLQSSQISRGELFNLTKRARNYAPIIKPLNAFTRNIEINSQLTDKKKNILKPVHPDITLNKTLKNDIHSLQKNIDLYHQHQQSFDSVFATSKKIDISAYCCYVHKQGIAGFINIENIPYFTIPMNKLPINDGCDEEYEIHFNELLSIYILLKSYSDTFKGKRIHIYCDNSSVIRMLNEYKAKDATNPNIQLIITKIAKLCMEYKINIHWSRIGGIATIIMDRLARSIDNPFQYSKFKPQSKPNPMASQYLKNIFD